MINMGEILIVNTAGVLVLVISLLSRIESEKEKHFSGRLYDIMIGITMGALAAETLSFALDGKPGILVHFLQYLLNAYLFLASCGVGTLWVLYVDNRIYHSMKRAVRLLIPIGVPYVLLAVFVLCDLFGMGFIFSVTEENVYFRGRLVFLPYLILAYDYATSMLMAVLAVKKRNHAQFFPIQYFVLPCLIGTVIQGLCYGLSVGWFCVSLAFMFVQVHLNNQNAFEDELSGLYNRKYCNYVIRKMAGSRKNETISGIMIDVNHFKHINDQFGHTTGDDAIRELGRLISEVIAERDMAFRHAGDEFIIISAVESEQDTQALMDSLDQKVAQFNATSGKPYELSLAMGYTLCKTAELDSDSFLHRMDVRMYEAKAAYYSRKGKDRRAGAKDNSK